MADDKRRFTRVKLGAQVEMTVNSELYTIDQITNLSIGGCLLPVNAEFEPGSECRLQILMDPTNNELSILIDGEIVRCEQGIIAVKFIGIDPDGLFHLQRIVLYNSPDSKLVEDEIKSHPGLV